MADIIKIKGKDYAPVAMRIQKFREDHGDLWTIETDLIHMDDTKVIMKAYVRNADGRVVSTGHGSALLNKSTVYAGREPEKAETSAIGRALAVLGYSTDDLLEDDTDGHLADSPVERKPTPPANEGEIDFMDNGLFEGSFVFVEAVSKEGKKPYAVYQAESDPNVKVNIFEHHRKMFHGLADDAKLPRQFTGTVKRDGKFWNLHFIASF